MFSKTLAVALYAVLIRPVADWCSIVPEGGFAVGSLAIFSAKS